MVHDEYPTGFRPDKIFNYEMMVPVPSNTTDLQYNLFIDPFDQCPVGLEGNFSLPGNIYGWVTDNASGVFLENALVSVDTKIFITGSDGFYNITHLQPGDYYLVAIKSAFNNYVHNITIIENSSTLHNI